MWTKLDHIFVDRVQRSFKESVMLDDLIRQEKIELHFDAVNENLPEAIKRFGGDSRKIFADEYIEDKANHSFELPYIYEGDQK